MHDRLSEILDREVVGVIVRKDGDFFDVGVGRLCLGRLSDGGDEIRTLESRLRKSFGGRLEVRDQLYLDAPQQWIRGWIEFVLHPDGAAEPYVLQVTTLPVATLYERRFVLSPGFTGDVRTILCEGLFELILSGVERPFRVLSGCDELLEGFLAHLEQAVRGQPGAQQAAVLAAAAVGELSHAVRKAWRLLPWPLREKIRPAPALAVPTHPLVGHEGGLRATILCAIDTRDGEVAYEYVHQHRPLEDYRATLGWMSDVADALAEGYPAPRYAVAMARAPSVKVFLDHFPSYQGVVGGGEPAA
ncbi:MAG TPA: hypothetical protein VKN99_20285 [Polyangia bacterium]|nr:hypothetical protein [Polyangia bacterium]